MTNNERLKFLKEKPNYACIPRENIHSVGCIHKVWTTEELQYALDCAKRSLELQIHLLNNL